MEEMYMLARKIRLLRELHDFTQVHVADFLGITQGTYSSVENGEIKLTYERLAKLADLYKMEVSDILKLNEQMIVQNVTNHNGGFSHSENIHINNQMPEEERSYYHRTIFKLEQEVERLRVALGEKKDTL